MNIKRIGFVAPLVLLGTLSGGPVWAHHGGANYGKDVVTLKATVTDFRFINPHVQVYFDAADDKGTVSHWGGEFPWNPGMLARYGWTSHTLKVGDQVTVVGRPVKSGAPVMAVSKVILADGTEMATSPTQSQQ
jgi:hypothetical protein